MFAIEEEIPVAGRSPPSIGGLLISQVIVWLQSMDGSGPKSRFLWKAFGPRPRSIGLRLRFVYLPHPGGLSWSGPGVPAGSA